LFAVPIHVCGEYKVHIRLVADEYCTYEGTKRTIPDSEVNSVVTAAASERLSADYVQFPITIDIS
jgi:hypothetical protein